MHTDKLKYRELTHHIIKGFYEVYTELGGGFLESLYEKEICLIRVNLWLNSNLCAYEKVCYRRIGAS
jgi:hypothetical protein